MDKNSEIEQVTKIYGAKSINELLSAYAVSIKNLAAGIDRRSFT
jgi:hypothetical protein